MPAITWGPKIEIGIAIIDAQHKQLVDLINALGEAMEQGRSQEMMGAAFKELVDYTHSHFRTEESLMRQHGYENVDEHHREHKIFIDQIEIYRDRFEAGSLNVTDALMDYLSGWLVTHVTVSDRAYLPTLQRAGVR